MTTLQLYEAILIELNKVKAPALSLSDLVYFVNKATQSYINSIYNVYEINQQKVDDLRVIRGSVKLPLEPVTNEDGVKAVYEDTLFENVYYTYLPDDYYHILNCIVGFEVPTKTKCTEQTSLIYQGARRLSSDANPSVINNYYFKPSYKNPYYYINNVNIDAEHTKIQQIQVTAPTFLIDSTVIKNCNYTQSWVFSNTDGQQVKLDPFLFPKITTSSIIPIYRNLLKQKNNNPKLHGLKVDLIDDDNLEISLLGYTELTYQGTNGQSVSVSKTDADTDFIKDRESYVRYGNNTKVRMEIRFGEGNKRKGEDKVVAKFVLVDYLKSPQRISLTQDQIDDIEDNTQKIEFPDYVIYEIINMTVQLVMENSTDLRLQTSAAVNNSIAPVTQAQK